MKTPHLAVAALLAFSSSAFSQIAAPAQSATTLPQNGSLQAKGKSASPTVAANYGKLPLSFEANEGQADPRAKRSRPSLRRRAMLPARPRPESIPSTRP